jgi:hypothetical protein
MGCWDRFNTLAPCTLTVQIQRKWGRLMSALSAAWKHGCFVLTLFPVTVPFALTWIATFSCA